MSIWATTCSSTAASTPATWAWPSLTPGSSRGSPRCSTARYPSCCSTTTATTTWWARGWPASQPSTVTTITACPRWQPCSPPTGSASTGQVLPDRHGSLLVVPLRQPDGAAAGQVVDRPLVVAAVGVGRALHDAGVGGDATDVGLGVVVA